MEYKYLDQLMEIPVTFGGALSPDGRWLAYQCRGSFAPVTQLYLVSSDGKGKAAKILGETEAEGWDCTDFSWSPDSRYLLVSQTRDGNELVRFMVVEIATHQWRQITKEQEGIFIHNGVLDPENRYIVYGANRDPKTGLPMEASVIYRHDIETGQMMPLAHLAKPEPFAPVEISNNGKYVLYHRADLHPAGSQIWIVGTDGTGDREIVNLGANVKAWGHWGKDDQTILVTGEAGTRRKIGTFSLAENKLEWLIDDASRDIAQIYWPKPSPLPMFAENINARLHVSLLDIESREETRLTIGKGSVAPLGKNVLDQWIVNHYHAAQPDRYKLAEMDQKGSILIKQELPLPEVAQGAISQELVPVEDFFWSSVDGLKIHGWLARVPGGKAIGTILYIHGGPTYHAEDEFSVQVQYLVKCGFNVIQPNYRGSTGYGLIFQEAIKPQGWGGLEQEDIKTCAEALIAKGIAEKGRIGITGVSYGGYSSWWAITHFPTDIIKASMPICGMTDLVVDYEGTRPDLRSYCEEMMGGSPKQVPERYYQRSPIHFVDRIRGKLLIVQGMTDPNVTPANLTEVSKKLDHAKIPYEVLAFEDEGHGIAKPANRRKLYMRMAEFFSAAFPSSS